MTRCRRRLRAARPGSARAVDGGAASASAWRRAALVAQANRQQHGGGGRQAGDGRPDESGRAAAGGGAAGGEEHGIGVQAGAGGLVGGQSAAPARSGRRGGRVRGAWSFEPLAQSFQAGPVAAVDRGGRTAQQPGQVVECQSTPQASDHHFAQFQGQGR